MTEGLDSYSSGSITTSAGDEASCIVAKGLAVFITADAIIESCLELQLIEA